MEIAEVGEASKCDECRDFAWPLLCTRQSLTAGKCKTAQTGSVFVVLRRPLFSVADGSIKLISLNMEIQLNYNTWYYKGEF